MNLLANLKELSFKVNMVKTVVSPRANGNYSGIQLLAENGKVTVFGSDGSASIAATIETATILEEGKALLPAMFSEIVAKQPSDEIQIKTEGNSVLILGKNEKKKTRSTLSIMDGNLSVPETDAETVFRMNANKLSEVINSVAYAISRDESRLVLTGLYLEVTPNEAKVTSLDGFRMSHCKVPGKISLPDGCDKVNGIIPGKAVSLLGKIARAGMEDEEIGIAVSKNGITAECAGFTMRSALIAGEYVDYERILPKESKIQAKVKKDALMQALGRISVYTTGNKQPAVKLVFSENTLKISANSPFGNMEEEIDAEIQGEGSLKIAFNANYLADTVKAIMMEDVIFKMGTSVSPVVVNDGETEKIELILPVRVYEAEEAA